MKKLILTFSLIAVLICNFAVSSLAVSKEYVVKENGDTVSIPQTHIINGFIRDCGAEGGKLTDPTDMYVGKDDCIYVADSGNNRIVKFDENGKYLKSFTCNDTLSGPSGVFVSENGDIYVADTLNERIVHLDSQGNFIEKFVKPDSEFIAKDSSFQISKIAISKQGYIYTLKSQYFMMIDSNNEFKGYIGDNKLGFSLTRLFIRTFASKEQKAKLVKDSAASYYSFDIGPDGMIYATTGEDSSSNQIQKINMVGDNVFAKKFFGEKFFNEEINRYVNPRFVDICVDNSGTIYAIESYSKRIFVYDPEGNMLSVFGGEGNIKGMFNEPVSVDENSKDEIYVLDKTTGYIHKFKKTDFMNNISVAIYHYSKGEYAESRDAWKGVLELDANYPVANKGIGDCYYKEKNTKEAMKYYKVADSKAGYGNAFGIFQYAVFRKHFGIIVAAIVVVCIGVFLLIKFLKNKAENVVDDYYSGGAE